ncbi:Fur family ferric uptake transcriptional regulator [Gelidibacter algens]|uniref:Fur family ferric uptake transcriptional regulator n=1 Tax=Gelidibacter algens TaxID=49280 RepID=A0A1A7R1L1_9FLAO|nr:transcriptional repressor [Gelidibacter algens]OBX26140.1 transcriptional regulator [Gelidibacter algens]RAJ24498.1 Fur family ferric uptake transcriptional regulator [Gelidibacter algens]
MDKLEKTLESRTVRPTAMRLLVLKFLLQKKVAVSLTNIEEYFDNSERTTLYRTLKTFEENGIVHQIDDGTGTIKYAVCEENCNCELEQDLHLHFYCNNCDETVCLTEYKIPHINLPEGYLAENVNLVIKGLCEKCSGH